MVRFARQSRYGQIFVNTEVDENTKRPLVLRPNLEKVLLWKLSFEESANLRAKGIGFWSSVEFHGVPFHASR